MNCEAYAQTISQYHDDELPDAARTSIEAHIADCRMCRDRLNHAQTIAHQLRSCSLVVAPAGLRQRILDLAPRTQSRFSMQLRNWLPRVAALAAGFVLYLFGFLFAAQRLTTDAEVVAAHIESVLHDTGTLLADNAPNKRAPFMLRPESRFLDEFFEENMQ